VWGVALQNKKNAGTWESGEKKKVSKTGKTGQSTNGPFTRGPLQTTQQRGRPKIPRGVGNAVRTVIKMNINTGGGRTDFGPGRRPPY